MIQENSFRDWRRRDPPRHTVIFLMNQHFMCVEQSVGTTVVYGKVKILIMLLNLSVTQGQCVMRFDGNLFWSLS